MLEMVRDFNCFDLEIVFGCGIYDGGCIMEVIGWLFHWHLKRLH